LLEHTPSPNVAGVCAVSVQPKCLGKIIALAKKLWIPPLIQPRVKQLDYPGFVRAIRPFESVLIIDNAYSILIRSEILLATCLSDLNLHVSLISNNRGPNPTKWTPFKGINRVGLTLNKMTDVIHKGLIVAQSPIPTFLKHNWTPVQSTLKKASEKLLEATLKAVYSGDWLAVSPIETESSSNRRRSTSDSSFKWTNRLHAIYRFHGALLPPHPTARSVIQQGNRVDIVQPVTPWTFGVWLGQGVKVC
jgi:methionyl-tRNA formyltransferase